MLRETWNFIRYFPRRRRDDFYSALAWMARGTRRPWKIWLFMVLVSITAVLIQANLKMPVLRGMGGVRPILPTTVTQLLASIYNASLVLFLIAAITVFRQRRLKRSSLPQELRLTPQPPLGFVRAVASEGLILGVVFFGVRILGGLILLYIHKPSLPGLSRSLVWMLFPTTSTQYSINPMTDFEASRFYTVMGLLAVFDLMHQFFNISMAALFFGGSMTFLLRLRGAGELATKLLPLLLFYVAADIVIARLDPFVGSGWIYNRANSYLLPVPLLKEIVRGLGFFIPIPAAYFLLFALVYTRAAMRFAWEDLDCLPYG